MDIRKAEPCDLRKVRTFYNSLIDQMHENNYYTAWEKDVYPDEKLMASFIDNGELFVGEEKDNIIAAMVLNTKGNAAYNDVHWRVEADPTHAMVLHILGVSLREKGRGYGRRMLEYARRYALQNNMRAIRMDVHITNITAMKLYEKMSYRAVDKVRMFYEGIGWHDFIMYELPINDDHRYQ